MKNWIKLRMAYWAKKRIRLKGGEITEKQAITWNFLQGIILSNGQVRWDWYKFRGIKVLKCSKCCKVLCKGTIEDPKIRKKVHCNECYWDMNR